MHNNNESEEPTTRLQRVRNGFHKVAHKTHSVSEVFHVGYFATGAGLLHEFHSFFAAGCGIALLIVIIAGINSMEG